MTTPPPLSFAPYSNEIQQAHFGQVEIGYDLFMKGLLHYKWQKNQETYIAKQKFGKKHNITRWI